MAIHIKWMLLTYSIFLLCCLICKNINLNFWLLMRTNLFVNTFAGQ